MAIYKIEIESNDVDGFKLEFENKALWDGSVFNLEVTEGPLSVLQISKECLDVMFSSMRPGSFKISTQVETNESKLDFNVAHGGGAKDEIRISSGVDSIIIGGGKIGPRASLRVS